MVLDREPLFIGISVSTLEKAFRVVDIGPNAESKEEVCSFVLVHSVFFFLQICVALHTLHPSPML